MTFLSLYNACAEWDSWTRIEIWTTDGHRQTDTIEEHLKKYALYTVIRFTMGSVYLTDSYKSLTAL